MQKTGFADLPLHRGECPPWLFSRMKALGGAVAEAIVLEYGQLEFLRRLSDPFFFQSLGCVLGFDWHSSGVTTTVCGALKEGMPDVGIVVCGGKGAASKRTPDEIRAAGERLSLSFDEAEGMVYASRLSAKVDNSAVQDGYQLYHHAFVLSEKGEWAVVQQGLNGVQRNARRYHWLSERVESFVREPQAAVCCDSRGEALNMVARESEEARKASVDLVKERPEKLKAALSRQKRLDCFETEGGFRMPARHFITEMNERNLRALQLAYEIQPKNYEELLAVQGVGPKTVRALALVADVVYGAPPSWRDPASFAFAHGGKDGIPYPVDRVVYDKSIEIMRVAIDEAKIGREEKLSALKRLTAFF